MNIVISAHFDIARPIMYMKLDNQKLEGLVDNFAGVFVSYQVHRQLGIPVYLTNYEELDYDGAIAVAQKLDKKNTLIVVIDTITESDLPVGKIASITNMYNIDNSKLKIFFGEQVHFIDGLFEETQDETWIYGRQYGFKTFYFGVPIPKDYHQTDNEITLKTIDNVTKVLVDVIKWFSDKENS